MVAKTGKKWLVLVICKDSTHRGVGFDLGTLHGYFSHKNFWLNLNFAPEHQIKLVLNCIALVKRASCLQCIEWKISEMYPGYMLLKIFNFFTEIHCKNLSSVVNQLIFLSSFTGCPKKTPDV